MATFEHPEWFNIAIWELICENYHSVAVAEKEILEKEILENDSEE